MKALLGRNGTLARGLLALVTAVCASGFAFAAAGDPVAADPVAVVVRVIGSVQVQKGQASAPVPAQVGFRLEVGDQVLIPTGGRAILLLKTGKTVTAQSSFRVQSPTAARPANVFQMTVKTLNEVSTSGGASSQKRAGMVRPVGGTPVGILPRNSVTLHTTRPRFAWFHVPGVTSYEIGIQAEGERMRWYRAGADTTWTAPAGVLQRGVEYSWTVATGRQGRAAGAQQFRVASDEEVARLKASLEPARALGLGPRGDGWFLAALAFRDAGMMYDAVDALARIPEGSLAGGAELAALREELHLAIGREPPLGPDTRVR